MVRIVLGGRGSLTAVVDRSQRSWIAHKLLSVGDWRREPSTQVWCSESSTQVPIPQLLVQRCRSSGAIPATRATSSWRRCGGVQLLVLACGHRSHFTTVAFHKGRISLRSSIAFHRLPRGSLVLLVLACGHRSHFTTIHDLNLTCARDVAQPFSVRLRIELVLPRLVAERRWQRMGCSLEPLESHWRGWRAPY